MRRDDSACTSGSGVSVNHADDFVVSSWSARVTLLDGLALLLSPGVRAKKRRRVRAAGANVNQADCLVRSSRLCCALVKLIDDLAVAAAPRSACVEATPRAAQPSALVKLTGDVAVAAVPNGRRSGANVNHADDSVVSSWSELCASHPGRAREEMAPRMNA